MNSTYTQATPHTLHARRNRALAKVHTTPDELHRRVTTGHATPDELAAWDEVDLVNYLLNDLTTN